MVYSQYRQFFLYVKKAYTVFKRNNHNIANNDTGIGNSPNPVTEKRAVQDLPPHNGISIRHQLGDDAILRNGVHVFAIFDYRIKTGATQTVC